ncbi:MAG: hypothetical protein AAGD10_18325 [Myxococcota bacterium]
MRKTIRTLLFSTVFASIALGVAPGFEARDAEAGWLQNVMRRIWSAVTGGGGRAVPELDPNVAGQAALIVLGGTAIALHRRRRDDQA